MLLCIFCFAFYTGRDSSQMMSPSFYHPSLHPSMWGFNNKDYSNGFYQQQQQQQPPSASPIAKELIKGELSDSSENYPTQHHHQPETASSPVNVSPPPSSTTSEGNNESSSSQYIATGHLGQMFPKRPNEGSLTDIPTTSSSSTIYPYFPSSGDLSSPLYGSYSTTGSNFGKTNGSISNSVSKAKSKAKANSGKSSWQNKILLTLVMETLTKHNTNNYGLSCLFLIF